MSLAPLFNSLASVGIFVAVRRMEVRRRTLFEVSADLAGFAITVALALALRNVWALVLGALAQVLVRAVLSYRLGGVRMGLALDPRAARTILHFGKWIFSPRRSPMPPPISTGWCWRASFRWR
jgi:O-antigen/teichoic acid export membrane protein